jgi:hypothetical protein
VGKELITDIVAQQAFEQVQKLQSGLLELQTKMDGLLTAAIQFNRNVGNIIPSEAPAKVKQMTAAMDHLAVTQKAMTKIDADLIRAQANYDAALSKTGQSLLTAEAAIKLYQTKLKELDSTQSDFNQKQKEYSSVIDQQRRFIEQHTDSVTKQRMNIGNYGSALDGTRAKLIDFGKSMLAAFSVTAIVEFAKTSYESFDKLEKQTRLLQNALHGDAAETELLTAQARKLSMSVGVKQEDILNIQKLAAAHGLSANEIKKVTEATLNFAAAMGEDTDSAARKLLATYEGQVGRLGRVDAAYNNITTEALKAGAAIDLTNQKFQNAATKGADASDRLSVAWNNFGLSVGRALVKSGIDNWLDKVSETLDRGLATDKEWDRIKFMDNYSKLTTEKLYSEKLRFEKEYRKTGYDFYLERIKWINEIGSTQKAASEAEDKSKEQRNAKEKEMMSLVMKTNDIVKLEVMKQADENGINPSKDILALIDKRIAGIQKMNAEQKKAADLLQTQKELHEKYNTWLLDSQAKLKSSQSGTSAEEIKAIADDEKQSFDRRLMAYGQYAELKQQAIDDAANVERTKLQNDAAAALLDNRISAEDKTNIETALSNNLIALNAKTNAEKQKNTKDIEKQTSDLLKKELDRRMSITIARVQIAASEELKALADKYSEGAISKENYEKEKLDITEKYAKLEMGAQLEQMMQQLSLLKTGSDEEIVLLLKIAKKKEEIAGKGIKTVENAEAEKQRLYEDTARMAIETAQMLASANFAVQQRGIEDETAKMEAAKDRELKAAGNNAEKKAAIEEKYAKQKELIDKKIRKMEYDKAIFDRTIAIAEITFNTYKTISALGPGSAIFGAIYLALAAAQVAAILATPLPKYAKGRKGGRAEFALVGEAGPEIVTGPEGTRVFDRPTVTYLPSGADVINQQQIADLSRRAMFSHSPVNVNGKPAYDIEKMVADEFERSADKIIQAIKNQPGTSVNISESGIRMMVQRASGFTEWINTNIKQ